VIHKLAGHDFQIWTGTNATWQVVSFWSKDYIGGWTNFTPGRPTLADLVRRGRAPAVFAESDDPNRLVPVVAKAEDIMIAVSGDPLRTNAYVFAHHGILGYPTTKPIGTRRSP